MKIHTLVLMGFISAPLTAAPSEQAVLNHYADLAQVMYQDALLQARELDLAVKALIAHPDETHLEATRAAWIKARHPYQQTEAYRFGNPIVDDWEGKVNAWPLDEGLIDYVARSYGSDSDENPYYTANIIANPKLTHGNRVIDTSQLNKTTLSEQLHELGDVESNVATGYHAIEFLLWGQDLNGTGPGAGRRPASDYDTQHCSGGHCDRRAAYLNAVSELLIDDLEWMEKQWRDDGAARLAVTQGDTQHNLATIFTGLGSLSYGELAGERMKLGLLLHDPEEEHDCFSDNTHWSHYNDALGIHNVYTGRYMRIDGRVLSGPSLSNLVEDKSPEADHRLRMAMRDTLMQMNALVESAEQGVAYDQLIGENNPEGNALVASAVEALVAQTRAIEKAVQAMGLEAITFEGSDSLDAPQKVR
ncbi:MAG: imelysin family protein [Candidatus Thiodiazotropha sp.]